MNTATFAAGCFWSVEDKFKNTTGVISAQSGYMGGHQADPTYEQVCSGTTGHAEVVHLSYDPSVVSYDQLLNIFWQMHDPTTLNQQGPDIGTQYRSAIFYHSAEQKTQAQRSLLDHQKQIDQKIVTEITEAPKFYLAEEYHQCYLEKNGLGSCR